MIETKSNNSLILLVLNELPSIFSVPAPLEQFENLGGIFHLLDREDTHGFYDWLRNESKQIIGVRMFFFEDYQSLTSHVCNLSYVLLSQTNLGNFLMTIFFGSDRKFNDADSTDQEFTGNYVYLSGDGRLAFTVECPKTSEFSSSIDVQALTSGQLFEDHQDD